MSTDRQGTTCHESLEYIRQVLSEKPMSGLNPLSMNIDKKDLEKVCPLII